MKSENNSQELANKHPLTVGECIRTYRKRARLSQSHLAKFVGVHCSSVSRWERDRRTLEMSLGHFLRIVEATKTPISNFFPAKKQ